MAASALKVAGHLSAELIRPDDARALLVLAHGAGADFRHANMTAISEALARCGVATMRFNFPFMETGPTAGGQPGRFRGRHRCGGGYGAGSRADLTLFLGGHSYGGRMASHAVADHDLPVEGLVFCLLSPASPEKTGCRAGGSPGRRSLCRCSFFREPGMRWPSRTADRGGRWIAWRAPALAGYRRPLATRSSREREPCPWMCSTNWPAGRRVHRRVQRPG